MPKLLQCTDFHLFKDANGRLMGMDTAKSFRAVIKHMQAFLKTFPADAILTTGDVSQDHTAASYTQFAEQITTLNRPVYGLLGNHDDQAQLSKTVAQNAINWGTTFQLGNWRCYLLNSQVEGAVYGQLKQSELDQLEHALQSDLSPSLIALHHHPVLMNSTWLDKHRLQNPSRLHQLVQQYPHVKVVTFGHVHQAFQNEADGTIWCSTPATSVQFKAFSDEFAVDPSLPPGFRWFDLSDDGSLKTGVVRLSEYDYAFSAESEVGYE